MERQKMQPTMMEFDNGCTGSGEPGELRYLSTSLKMPRSNIS